jgi:hypothetical protein
MQHTRRIKVFIRCLVLGLVFLPTGAARAETAANPVFREIGAGQGIDLTSQLTESLAWGDYDHDGDQDLYLTSNGPNNLYRNDGSGRFTDVTAMAGVGHGGFSVGAAFGDLDNDGDLDLYVVSFGAGFDVLYRNDGPVGPGGEYEFTDVSASAQLTEQSSTRGVALLDYDRDSLLDVYVNADGPDILYHNLGNLQFVNVAGSRGINNTGAGVGIVATDLDRNGWIDVFAGNRSGDPNRVYLNHQTTMTDVTANGVDEVGLGMGVLSFDYDNDLDFDLYWTTWPSGSGDPRPNALYENLDGSHFADVAAASGTGDPDGWGISCNAGDIDNDGWEDFFVTNGFDPGTTPNVLFQNQGDGTFQDVTFAVGGGVFDGRGVAFADFDNDGDLDLCITADAGDPTQLWRNDSITGHHWITFELEGTCSNRSAIGARVVLTTDAGSQAKEVSSGAGRGSQNSLPVEFGLGVASSIVEARIFWPSGISQVLTGIAMDQILPVIEPCVAPTLFVGHDELLWTRFNQGPPMGFDLVRGDLLTLRSTAGDFTAATLDCLTDDLTANFLPYGTDPAVGGGFWFLVREVVGAVAGTYDEPSGSQVGSRDAEIDAAPGACP